MIKVVDRLHTIVVCLINVESVHGGSLAHLFSTFNGLKFLKKQARCRRVFEGWVAPLAKTNLNFWLELIHTLWGQLDKLQGDSDIRIQ